MFSRGIVGVHANASSIETHCRRGVRVTAAVSVARPLPGRRLLAGRAVDAVVPPAGVALVVLQAMLFASARLAARTIHRGALTIFQ